MNKLYIVLISLSVLTACSKEAKTETDIVKAHMLHLEQLTDTTNLTTFLKGIQAHQSWGDFRITDNRLLKFSDTPIESVKFETDDDGVITNVTLILFKDTEKNDAEQINEYLTKNFGEPQIDEYYKDNSIWKDESKSTNYTLKVAEDGYSNDSELIILFKKVNNYNY